MLKCTICGHDFSPAKENHYISRDKELIGGMAAAISKSEPAMYDTFDCPLCGCQVIAQERRRKSPPWILTKNLILPDKEDVESLVEEIKHDQK